MFPHRRMLMSLALVALLGAAASGQPAKPAAFDADRLAKVPEVMKKFVDERKVAGVVTLVATRDKVVQLEAVGMADIEGKRAMSPDSIFWIASMTKPITATALMILVDEGKVNVDDPVSKFILSFKDVQLNGKPPAREITLRDLMSHTSGIGEAGASQSVAGFTLEMISDRIAATPMKFEPGEKWNYGSGLTVIGRIVEIVSKQNYADFVQRRILDPVGMKETTFHLTAAQLPRVAKNYKPGKDRQGLEESPNPYVPKDPAQKQTPNPSGGLFSTAGDMARFYQMILGGGHIDGKRILSEKAVKQMTSLAHDGRIVTGFTPGSGWGLGWILVREPQGATAALTAGSHGHGGAYGTQGWIDPNRGIVYVMMIQRTGFGNGDDSDIRRAFQGAVFEAIKQ